MNRDEVLNFIMSRRSIRKFTQEPVSEEDLMVLLKAAMSAPSARNDKPWAYVVVQKREILNNLSEAHPYGKMLKDAPLAIAVVGEKNADYWIHDCSASTENILLAASGLGLGSVWLGIHPRQDRMEGVRKILEIPENMETLSLIAIGHPKEFPTPRTQYDPEKIHKEKW